MPLRSAAVLRTLLVAFVLSWAAGAPGVCRAADADPAPVRPGAAPFDSGRSGQGERGKPGYSAPSAQDERGTAGRPRPRDVDQDLIDHLDVIENLELLQNLDLFDTGAPRGE